MITFTRLTQSPFCYGGGGILGLVESGLDKKLWHTDPYQPYGGHINAKSIFLAQTTEMIARDGTLSFLVQIRNSRVKQ